MFFTVLPPFGAKDHPAIQLREACPLERGDDFVGMLGTVSPDGLHPTAATLVPVRALVLLASSSLWVPSVSTRVEGERWTRTSLSSLGTLASAVASSMGVDPSLACVEFPVSVRTRMPGGSKSAFSTSLSLSVLSPSESDVVACGLVRDGESRSLAIVVPLYRSRGLGDPVDGW